MAHENFEIRVGLDGTDLGNNAVCYKQMESMAEGATVKYKCHEKLYGSWVSVNKTASLRIHAPLQIVEVGVYELRAYNGSWYGLVIYCGYLLLAMLNQCIMKAITGHAKTW